MSGPTNRRFVRSAWTLLAFQFVAAGGAMALSVWAATRVQVLIDQRDMLQARVTQLESHPVAVEPSPEIVPVPDNQAMPMDVSLPEAGAPLQPPPPAPPMAPPSPRAGGSGVTVHTPSTTPPPRVDEPLPPREPPVTYVPPRDPPVRYVPRPLPPREPPVHYPPPRDPPVSYVPPRQPPTVLVPPRLPPEIGRPRPTRPTPQQPIPGTATRPNRPVAIIPPGQQPVPGIVGRPTRPPNLILTRPARPTVTQPQVGAPATNRPATNSQPIDPRRIRRPRPIDGASQQDPPK